MAGCCLGASRGGIGATLPPDTEDTSRDGNDTTPDVAPPTIANIPARSARMDSLPEVTTSLV